MVCIKSCLMNVGYVSIRTPQELSAMNVGCVKHQELEKQVVCINSCLL